MSETESITRLEEIYRELMGSDVSTQQEVKAKAEIISLLPLIKAVILAEDTPEAQQMAQQLEMLYDQVSKWNPLTSWFRDAEDLVKLYFDMLSKTRLFLIRRRGPSEQSSALVSESLESIRQTINQLTPIMEEIRVTIKTLLEIISPTPEVHARIAALTSRSLELEKRIEDFGASGGEQTEADQAKIQHWKTNLQKINQQIETLRKIAHKRR